VGAARCALADRHVDAGVPPVGLEDLSGHIDGALVVARCEERRAYARQVFLEDADAAAVALALQVFADHRAYSAASRSPIPLEADH
jgi:hypothetical protein